MTKLQTIIAEMDQLDRNELEIILHEVVKKIESSKIKLEVLKKYRGVAKGIWSMDAQEYVNQLREED